MLSESKVLQFVSSVFLIKLTVSSNVLKQFDSKFDKAGFALK